MKIGTTIGVDLPECQLNTAALDEGGRLVERRVMDTKCRKKTAEYFGSYGGRAQVTVESAGIKLRGQNLETGSSRSENFDQSMRVWTLSAIALPGKHEAAIKESSRDLVQCDAFMLGSITYDRHQT
jgi:hypothetical protein